MAVSGVSSSKSIYGNRNVITGLASGMDTEGMLENMISAYKNKIATLNQKRTKTVWQQDAYRSIISKMASFTSKYTSYQSSNNLMSTSFFNQAVKTVSKGANADKVSATGRSSSNIQIDRVFQLASAATYKCSGSALDPTTSSFGSDKTSSTAGEILNLDGTMKVSGLTGSLTLAYGGSNSLSYLTIDFDDTTLYQGQTDEKGNLIRTEQALVNEINRQLESQSITIGSKTYTGKELTANVLRAEFKDGKITFADPKGNNVYVSDASGAAQGFLNGREISGVKEKQVKDLALTSSMKGLLETKEKNTLSYLEEKSASLTITVDGVTKAVRMPSALLVTGSGTDRDKKYLELLQKNIDNAFGKGKLTVSDANGDEDGIQFKFEAAKGSTFSVYSGQGKALGFGESKQVTSYLNTGKTLGELLSGTDFAENFKKAQVLKTDADGNVAYKDVTDANGKQLYSFVVNGKEIGQFNEDSTFNDVMNAMNSNSASGVNVSFSKLTNELTFTAKDTGEASEVKFEGLAAALFGTPGADGSQGTYTKGQDAIFEASINGTSLGQLKRSSNSVELDGMTVNLKGTFGYETNDDGSVKYVTMYDTSYDKEGNERIVFKYGDGKELYGKVKDDGTVQLFDDDNKPFRYNEQEVFGKIDKDGKLSFYVSGGEGEEDLRVYLRDNDTFSVDSHETLYDTDDKGFIFKYGDKQFHGTLKDDGTVEFLEEDGLSFTYDGKKVSGKMDKKTGELSFYIKDEEDNEHRVYLLDDGNFSVFDHKTLYGSDEKGIIFKYGDKQLHGTLKNDGTVEFLDEGDISFTYDGQKVYGRIDGETGELSFHMKDAGDNEHEIYLLDNGSFSVYNEKTVYETDDKGRIAFHYGDGKTLYAQLRDDGTYDLFNEKGTQFKWQPSNPDLYPNYAGQEVRGVLNDDGSMSFYIPSKDGSGETMQLYLQEVGAFSKNPKSNGVDNLATIQAATREASAVTPGTTVTNLDDVKPSVTVTELDAVTAATTATRTAKVSNTEAVTFETSSDADKIVDVIKQMVEDYNAMVTEIKNAYSTLPAQKSSGVYYEPLTDEEEEGMSESFINSWNEKAKQGILFGDGDLRNLYTRLTSAVSMTGEFGATLRAAGITVNYYNGLSTLDFDENKFRTALENDPDKIRNAFTSSVDSGASSNGLMQALKAPLDMYGQISGGKGILVGKAGSPLAASSMYSNTLQSELDKIDAQIEKWQDLMNNRVDYYTGQFSRLEQLVQQMNTQSSYFAQLMGGYQ